jgi:DNA-binding transcriptional ArsR family regulator
LKIYNPTYGAIFDIDETKPADPEEIGAWQLSYAAHDRGLTSEEIDEIKAKGRIGFYPDEFVLVDSNEWPATKVNIHCKAVHAFDAVNQEGPRFRHADRLGNKSERIRVDFVPGPIVDMILSSGKRCTRNICDIILYNTASRFKHLKSFQRATREHARALVKGVRKVTKDADLKMFARPQEVRTTRKRILGTLSQASSPMTPIQVASSTGLNRNTVRRELQDLLDDGLVVRDNHSYSFAKIEGSESVLPKVQ